MSMRGACPFRIGITTNGQTNASYGKIGILLAAEALTAAAEPDLEDPWGEHLIV